MSKPDHRLKEIDRIVETMASAPSTAWPELKVIKDEPSLATVSVQAADPKIGLSGVGGGSSIPYAPPIIRAPSASAESVRAAYEAAAVRAEQVAEELANLLTVERDSAIKLAAELRKVGDREAEAISKVCDRAAEAHKLLETLRKGLTEGAADSK